MKLSEIKKRLLAKVPNSVAVNIDIQFKTHNTIVDIIWYNTRKIEDHKLNLSLEEFQKLLSNTGQEVKDD